MVLSMTAGMAGRLLSESAPWPWTGAEMVDGKPVGFAKVLVGATEMLVTRAGVDEAAVEVDLAEMTMEATVEPLIERDVALTEDPTLTAMIVAEPAPTPKRGDDDPSTLTPKVAPLAAVEAEFMLIFKVELDFAEATARLTRGSARGAVIARPQRIETIARNFML
jgi:hypothetical protein